MNALSILLFVVTVIYLAIYQSNYWKYFFGILIPYYFITQILLCDFKTNTSKKKFFISSWTHPFDSQIYASDKIDIMNLRSFLDKYNKEHNTKIGITVFIMKMLGNLFQKYPKLNGNVLFGLFIKKPQIDISCMITTNNGLDTQTITIKDTDKLSLEELSNKVNEKKQLIEKNLDINVNRKKFCCSFIPSFMLAPFLRIMSYLSACGVNLSWLGLPKYSYGTAIIANYGKIGMSDTFLPICRKFIKFFIIFSSFFVCPVCCWDVKSSKI